MRSISDISALKTTFTIVNSLMAPEPINCFKQEKKNKKNDRMDARKTWVKYSYIWFWDTVYLITRHTQLKNILLSSIARKKKRKKNYFVIRSPLFRISNDILHQRKHKQISYSIPCLSHSTCKLLNEVVICLICFTTEKFKCDVYKISWGKGEKYHIACPTGLTRNSWKMGKEKRKKKQIIIIIWLSPLNISQQDSWWASSHSLRKNRSGLTMFKMMIE